MAGAIAWRELLKEMESVVAVKQMSISAGCWLVVDIGG
jgi:hypothetical protein